MRQMWKQLVAGVLGLALVLPAAVAFSQDEPARDAVRDEVDRNVEPTPDAAPQASPSDMPPPLPMAEPSHSRQVQPMPRQYMGTSCCCGGRVVYSRGYPTAQVMPRSGYRSYSYQADSGAAYAAPLPARSYDTYYGDSYWTGSRSYNGANWDRHHESDRTNFSGSYGSKATLYHGGR